MTATATTTTFDGVYETWRPRLYRALVLATGDPDGAVDAVDTGFARTRRAVSRSGDRPPAEALGSARRRLATGRGGYSGFRLPGEQPPPDVLAVVEAVRSLDVDDRFAVVASRYLGWDDATVGEALGMLPAEAGQRIQVGTGRVLAAVGSTDPAMVDAALDVAASTVPVPLSRVETVKRSARMRVVGTAAGVLAAVVAVAGGVALVAGTTLGDDPTSPAAQVVSPGSLAELEWQRAVLPMSESGEMQAVSAGDDGYLGLFVDHGRGNQAPQAFTSPNGLDWEVAGVLPLGQQGGWVSHLSYADGRWIAVGSSWDPAAGGDQPLVMASEDGSAWTQLPIPAADEVVVGDIPVTVGTNLMGATVTDGSVTVFGTQWGDFEPVIRELIPEDLPVDFGWGANPDGTIDIFGSDGDVAASLEAADLGIAPEDVVMMSGGRVVAYRSSDDGETWEAVPLAGANPGWVNAMGGAGGRLFAAFGTEFGSALYRLDGEQWARVDLGDAGTASTVAGFDGDVYAAGADAAGNGAVWRSDDGETWEKVDLPALAGVAFNMLSASPHGIVAVGYPGAVVGPAVVEVGDLTVTISSGGVYTVTDADGQVVVEVFEEDLGRTDPLAIVDPDTGEVVVRVDRAAIDAAWQEVFQFAEQVPVDQPSYTIVATADGQTWVRVDLEEALPPGFSPNYQVVGPGGVLLAGWADQAMPVVGEGGGPQVWVGTTD